MLPLNASDYVFGSVSTKLPVVAEERIIIKRNLEQHEKFSSSDREFGSFAYLLEKMH